MPSRFSTQKLFQRNLPKDVLKMLASSQYCASQLAYHKIHPVSINIFGQSTMLEVFLFFSVIMAVYGMTCPLQNYVQLLTLSSKENDP